MLKDKQDNPVVIDYNVYCLVKLTNNTECLKLTNPKVFYKSGKMHIDLPTYKEMP